MFKNNRLKILKQELCPPVHPLVKNSYDANFPNFSIMIQSLLLLLTEGKLLKLNLSTNFLLEENSKRFIEKNSFHFLIEHLENNSQTEITNELLKLIANLSQFGK